MNLSLRFFVVIILNFAMAKCALKFFNARAVLLKFLRLLQIIKIKTDFWQKSVLLVGIYLPFVPFKVGSIRGITAEKVCYPENL